MKKFTIELSEKSLLNILTNAIKEEKDNKEMLEIFKIPDILESLKKSQFSFPNSPKANFFEFLLNYNNPSYIKYIFSQESTWLELGQQVLSSIKLIKEKKVSGVKILNSLPGIYERIVHLETQQQQQYEPYRQDIMNTLKFAVSTVLLKNSKENEEFLNARVYVYHEKNVPLFFNLLNYFSDNTEQLKACTNIKWALPDSEGSTLLHKLLDYDVNLFPLILSKLEQTDIWNKINKMKNKPTSSWSNSIANLEIKKIEKLVYIFDNQLISWEDKKDKLLEIFDIAMFYYYRRDNVESVEPIKKVIKSILTIESFLDKEAQEHIAIWIKKLQGNKSVEGINKLKDFEAIYSYVTLHKDLQDKNNKTAKHKI